MIQAQELMLNNWVLRDEKPVQIISIGSEIACDDEEGYFPEDAFEPIPLSPDLLEKAGFEKAADMGDQTYYVNKDWYVAFNHDDIEFGAYKSPGQIHPLMYDSECLQHLHQLQNLMASLGQPLNISL